MDHPSKEWKDRKTQDLLTEKQNKKILDYHIRFKGLIQGDERDHEMCFLWEYNRTRVFMKEKLDFADSNITFPFYIENFYEKPYRSYPPKQRRAWELIKGENTFNYEEDLLHPFLGTTKELDLATIDGILAKKDDKVSLDPKRKLDSYKAPVTLYINPTWNKTKFLSLVRDQTDRIYNMLESEKQNLEKRGYVFAPGDDTQPIRTWDKRLKALGHYRLLKCVGLDEHLVRHWYGDDSYIDEKTMNREIMRSLPHLKKSFK